MGKNNSVTSMEPPSQSQSTITLTETDCKKDAVYNPLDHRKLEHPTSTVGSFFHLLKSSLGSGLLSMPVAFKYTGIIPGCIGTILVGVIATHCVHILVATSRDICRHCHVASFTYTDTCENVFKLGPKKIRKYSTFVRLSSPRWASLNKTTACIGISQTLLIRRYFMDSAMAGVCLGGTSVYVIFIATSLKNICENLSKDFEIPITAYCGILMVPLILITQVRYLKFLVPFSVIANLSLVLTFGITCWYTFSGMPHFSNVKLVDHVSQWPLFISIAIFAMEGINVVMPVENEMANPEHFLGCPGVLNLTMIFVMVLYGTIGLFGYLKYGEDVQASITLNLPDDEALALTAKVLVVVAVFFTYCLQMYAPMDIIWTRLRSRFNEKYHNLFQILQRIIFVIFTVVVAIVVPDLGLLIGLVGAIFFSTLGLLVPIVIETVHKWERGLGKYSYILWKNAVLFLVYVIVLIAGCYSAVSEIVLKFSQITFNITDHTV